MLDLPTDEFKLYERERELYDSALSRCGTPQHGLSSNTMALITSHCGTMRSLSIKWP